MAKVNYKVILDEAWRQHLAPKGPNAPTVISLFAGCGGSSLGYSMAGFRELLAVEWDGIAAAIFESNIPGVPVYHGDIRDLSVGKCLELVGLEPGELDLLDGSPPCQGFSTAGKREMGDERNRLYMEFVRLLEGLRPRAFVMENVSGLVKGRMKLVFADIMRRLKAAGYEVGCRLMDAMYFYVPQSRCRLIWVGMRDDLGVGPNHPKPAHIPFTVFDAWKGCEVGEIGRLSPAISKVVPKIPAYGDGSDVTGKLFFSTKRLAWNRPARTLNRDMVGSRSAMIHPDHDRPIGVGEAKRLSSFPDGFIFTGGYKQAMNNLGNSVPPLFMRAIALHIRSLLAQADMGLEPRLSDFHEGVNGGGQ